ncbi:MAG: alkaline phosphatase family protein, partial [Gemmatimonadales bacterium]
GWSYRGAVHDHARTYTSPGHATLVNGLHPSRHGIVSNYWWVIADSQWVRLGAVADPETPVTGYPDETGASPGKLLASGLPDWLQQADPEARVVSLSGKPTTAVLMAGRSRGHVYWFEDDLGIFATSVYYRDKYPDWVERFNRETLAALLADSIWELGVPASARGLARRDTADYELDGEHTFFPHRFYEEVAPEEWEKADEYYNWWKRKPSIDQAIVGLAREAVTELELGQRGSVDYLALGLSATDWVGHRFGPYSLEQLDNLLRLDQLLGGFFDFLDTTVGEGAYVVALSSDHGVLPLPEHLEEIGTPGWRIPRLDYQAARRAARAAAAKAGTEGEASAKAAEALRAFDFIAEVITVEELAGPESADSLISLHQRSYYPGRVWGNFAREGVVAVLAENALASYGDRTTHGSPYLYDRRIPIIFMGRGIASGSSDERARTVDVAPTIAELIGIAYPEDLDGRALRPGQ